MTSRIASIMPSRRWEVLSQAELDRLREADLHRARRGGGALSPRARRSTSSKPTAPRSTASARSPACRAAVVEAALARGARASSRSAVATRPATCPSTAATATCPTTPAACSWSIPASGERRASTLADVAASARFVDALPEVAFYWGPIVAAGTRRSASRALHEAAAVLANTSKHFQAVTCVGERPARLLVEMAAAFCGGPDELRRRPLVSLIACPVDPLGNDAVSLEAGLVCAAAGVPCGFLSLTAGLRHRARLAGRQPGGATPPRCWPTSCCSQLASPGAPVFFAGAPSVMDLRTGGYTGGGPEDDVLAAAATQLGHFVRPAGQHGHHGHRRQGARLAGGVDDALSTAASVLAGADMMSGCGLLDGSRTLSYPHLVMETEVYRIVQRLAEGIVVDQETLALDVIRRVGPQRHLPGRQAHPPPRGRDLAAGRSGTARPTTPGSHPASRARSRTPPRSPTTFSPTTGPRRSPTTCAPSWRHRGPGRRELTA